MDFSFVQITDHHLRESEEGLVFGFSPAHSFRAVMRHIAENVGERADFIISTGDLITTELETSPDAVYQNSCRMLNIQVKSKAPGPQLVSLEGLNDFPMYFLPGNHDDRPAMLRNLSCDAAPMALMNLVFVHKGVQFICLDWGPKVKAVASPETLEFLSSSLQSDLPSILMMHHHVAPVGGGWLDGFIADDVQKFWRILRNRKVLGIVSGHVHATTDALVRDIPVLTVRSTAWQFALQDEFLPCLQPPHYRLFTVRDGILTSRVFEVRV